MNLRANAIVERCRDLIAKSSTGDSAISLAETCLDLLFEDGEKTKHHAMLSNIADNYTESNTEGDIADEIAKEMAIEMMDRLLIEAEFGSNMPIHIDPSHVFVVHGHRHELRDRVAEILTGMGLKPIILSEQLGASRTIIELIERYSNVGFAVCLFTADDVGGRAGDQQRRRARQNVVFETGYFFALLGRDKVFVIAESNIELPSDLLGLRSILIDSGEDFEQRLILELQHAGLKHS